MAQSITFGPGFVGESVAILLVGGVCFAMGTFLVWANRNRDSVVELTRQWGRLSPFYRRELTLEEANRGLNRFFWFLAPIWGRLFQAVGLLFGGAALVRLICFGWLAMGLTAN